ncbi:unnamed protein product [Closterium sp. Naga37s-1]|nr:unnamed protein product [Closterium sp. Naga37s-1]
METATHINDLPDDILAKILWHCEESTPWKPESDALWSRHSLSPKPRYLRSIVLDKDPSPEEEDSYPVSYPPAIPTAAKIFLVSSVCRRWRDVAQRNISTLLVERKQAISLQQLSNAVACFPNLTHLHLCDDSVETLDDTFLAHLASSCPQLKFLHVGRSITHHPDYVGPKQKHPITEAGLDRFFQRCTQLEQLSLLCLHPDVHLPASFFHLTRLHTLALTAASALEAPDLETLGSLTNLHVTSPEVTEEQLANVRRLPSITGLSLSAGTSFSPHGSAAFAIAQLPLIKSLDSRHVLLSDWPLTSLERLQISDCRDLKRLPARIAELLPRLRELTVSRCHALEELPEGAYSLKHLETLSLIKCDKFRCLPVNVGRLSALSTLVLDLLPLLASLPASICQLSSLETFFLLSCDSIRELPAGFGCLTALTTLCLERVALPADIGRLSNLHTLLVTTSFGYPHLPCSLSKIASLTRLELNGCGVELLPEGVGSLSSMRELHVSSCPRLTALPASVTGLTALEALSLADCHNLTSAPTRLDGLTRLKRLELARCDMLTRPPLVLPASIEWLGWGGFRHAMPLPDVSTLTGLRTLRLDVVAVGCGVAVSRSLSHLEHLQLTLANDAEELPFALTFLSHLRTLIIDYAINLQRLPADIGSALPQLRKLKLVSAYELGELPASVTALQNLTSLTACNAPLASLPDGIGALSRLRELDLYNSDDLDQLPASLTHLTRLNLLSITACPIRSLCPTVSQFSRLRSLSLSGCAQLEALPGDVSALTALRSLDVEECGHVTDTDGSVLPRSINEVYGLKVSTHRCLAGVTGWLALCLTPPPLPLCTPLPGASQVSLGGWAAVPAATPAPRVPYPLSPLHTRPRQAPPRCRWWRTQQVHSPPLSYSHLPSRLSRLHFPPRRLPGVTGGALSRRVAGPLLDCLHAEYGHADVALLLSLGSPHLGRGGGGSDQRSANADASHLSRPPPPAGVQGVVDQTRGLLTHMQAVSPGAFHAPHVKYVCVSGRYDTVAYVHMPVSHAGEAFPARQPAFPFPITSSPQPHPPNHAAVAAAAGGEARVFALDVKPVGVGGAATQAAGGSDSEPESESEGERKEGSSGASGEKNQEAVAGRQVQVASGGGVFQARMVGQGYKQVCGRADVWGDGVVPEDAALLEGVENLILDGVYHSPVGASEARPWYGSPSVLPSWQHHLLA